MESRFFLTCIIVYISYIFLEYFFSKIYKYFACFMHKYTYILVHKYVSQHVKKHLNIVMFLNFIWQNFTSYHIASIQISILVSLHICSYTIHEYTHRRIYEFIHEHVKNLFRFKLVYYMHMTVRLCDCKRDFDRTILKCGR